MCTRLDGFVAIAVSKLDSVSGRYRSAAWALDT